MKAGKLRFGDALTRSGLEFRVYAVPLANATGPDRLKAELQTNLRWIA